MLVKKQDENVLLLKEKILSLEGDKERAEKRCEGYDNLEINNQILKNQLRDKQAQHDQSLALLTEKVKELDGENERLAKRRADLENQLSQAQQHRNVEREESSSIKTECTKSRSQVSRLEEQTMRTRKRYELVCAERDSLRNILMTYDADLTSTSHHLNLQRQLKLVTKTSEEKSRYVDELEKRLQLVQNQSMQLSEKNQQALESINAQKECKKLSEENEALKDKLESQGEKMERLEQKIEWSRLRGDFNPDSTKVIHFKMNPADLARDEEKKRMSELQQENMRLKCKLKELEQGHEVSMSEIMMSRQAKENLRLLELRNERTKEVMLAKNKQLRQVCYQLFGYQIEYVAEGQYKLLSDYAESQNDFLLFRIGDSQGEMELMESSFSQKLTHLIELHLHQQRCIPVFLCAVTLELFGEQTMLES